MTDDRQNNAAKGKGSKGNDVLSSSSTRGVVASSTLACSLSSSLLLDDVQCDAKSDETGR